MMKLGLRVQHLLAQVFIPFTFAISLLLMKVILGYRWEDMKTARRKIQKLVRQSKAPLMICPNHLTMIDSLILVWAMTPFWKALGHPELFPWNTPEKTNYAHQPVLRFFTYVGKCLPVLRSGPQEKTKEFLDKIKLLLSWGQSLMMFPEGTRSVSGRVDTQNYAYGVGKIIDDMRQEGIHPRVLILYQRGRGQTSKSTIPHRGEKFYLEAELLDPQTSSSGMRASRDISTQIIQALAAMEETYLLRNPKLAASLPPIN